MKCIKCSSNIDENNRFCPICGAEQPDNKIKKMFCPKCGLEIPTNVLNCPNCNSKVSDIFVKNAVVNNTPKLVKRLIITLTTEAIMWIIIGLFQMFFFLLIAIVTLSQTVLNENFGLSNNANTYMAMIIYIVVGSSNIVMGITDIINANKLKRNFSGIVHAFSLPKAIKMYIWNGIVLISLFASLFTNPNCIMVFFIILLIITLFIDIIGVRLYVSNNKDGFYALESFTQKQKTNIDTNTEKQDEKELYDLIKKLEAKKKSEDSPQNKITCPVCGKEQTKNSFGCIFCHSKWDDK